MAGEFEQVIGLEVHAQLLTKTKAFCGCSTAFGARPNTHVCPVCLGLPGSLPVLNREAVRMAVRIGLALGCEVQEKSIFARKNYFYPDLPKGYQISQYDTPLCTGGSLDIGKSTAEPHIVGIVRVHMEEDAGKNMHGFGGDSVVDLNRAGTPLVEIVGAPDLRSSAEAAEYLRRLRDILMALGVNDGNLEEGSFRCDANVSVRRHGAPLGTRCEIKNVNSFRFVEKAIDYEAARQILLIEGGQKITQETRRWDEATGKTYSLRSKEDAHDYRYFPEPDLPPLVVDAAFVGEQRQSLEELPAARRKRLTTELGLSAYAASVLTAHPRVAEFFERAARLHGDPVKVANFVQTEVLRAVTTTGLHATFPVTEEQIAELLRLVDDQAISGKQAKDVYSRMAGTPKKPAEIVRESGMAQLADAGELEAICRRIVEQNPKQVAGYRAGKTSLMGFFVGQVMKETQGRANPGMVNEILGRLLTSP
jgi:aspartyl-tRNA(Asn)/glutamyl-tRNA(Gln) amidotransferase subunit B